MDTVCRYAFKNMKNLMPAEDQIVGFYTPTAGSLRHFVKHPCVGIAYVRTIIDMEGTSRLLHTPYLFCQHCKQGGGTTVTHNTAWHQISAGHMSSVRSEGAMVSEEFLEHQKWNAFSHTVRPGTGPL